MTSDCKAIFWQQHIDSCSRSLMNQKQYCQKHSLAVATFSYWKKKLRNQKTPDHPRFYPLTVQKPQIDKASQPAGLSIHVTGRELRVELADNFSTPALKKLLDVLRQP